MDSSPSSTYSSSSSSSSSSNHPASLVDPAMHSPHTLRLVSLKITKQLIDHVVDQVIETVDYAMGKSSSSSSTRGRRARTPNQTKFTGFVSTVLTRAEITTPTLLATLIYIHRARPYLHIALEEWALERVFLGALITASKYLNDSTLKNVHWALCTGVFGKRDVGRIEREFLAVLDWELSVSENEILGLWQSLEWAVEMEEQEERRIQERENRMFYIPATPSKKQRRAAAPIPIPSHSPSDSTSSSSSSSSSPPSSASSSSSSSLSSPRTPVDFELGYPSAEELARMQKAAEHQQEHDVTDMEIDSVPTHVSLPQVPQPVQKRSVKRSFGTAAMVEMLKSFPFPGHHHHSSHHHHSQPQHPIRA